MFHSSWNSNAFQQFCATLGIRKVDDENEDQEWFVLFNTDNGTLCDYTCYSSYKEAEEARKRIYDRINEIA